jgi:hypothetical protein
MLNALPRLALDVDIVRLYTLNNHAKAVTGRVTLDTAKRAGGGGSPVPRFSAKNTLELPPESAIAP